MAAGVGGSSITISVLSGLNIGLGVINQIVIANYFGTSAQLDSFLIASAVPSVFSGIALSLFSSSLVPILTPIRLVPKELSKAVSAVTVFTGVIIGFVVIGGVSSRELILNMSTHLDKEQLDLAARLAGYMWVISGLIILNCLCASLLNLFKRFVLAAVLGPLPTVGMIAGTLLFGSSLGIEGLVVGYLAMSILSSVLLVPILVKCGFSLREVDITSPHAKEFLTSLIPLAIGLLPFTILPAIDAFWASRLPEGSMSYIGYCTKIVIAIGSLVVSGIYVVILPYLSENVAANDLDAFVRRLRLAIKYVLLVTIPLVTFFAFFGREMVAVLFERGRFSEESTWAVATLLPFYLMGLLAMAPATILSRGYVALRRYQGFGLLSLSIVAVYWVLSGVLSSYYSFYGIGVTYGIYWVLFFSAGILLLDRSILNRETLMSALKCGVCSVVGSAVAYVVFSGSLRLPVGMTLLLEGCLATVLFLLLANYLKVAELDGLRAGVLSLARKQGKCLP